MSRPKYFIKTTVKVYGGRTKYEVVKGFFDADSIAKVGSERDATRLCEEFERLTDENARLKAKVERLTKAEVERLRKEGEAMYPKLGPGWSHNAKEGKPQS